MPRRYESSFRRKVNRLFRSAGYMLEDIDGFRPRKETTLKLLAGAGIQPKTVFDVGVHRYGTTCLYEAFPDARHVLIEPVQEFRDDIRKLSERIRDVDLIWAAAANYEGTASLEVTPGLTHSKLQDSPKATNSRYDVDVITLDGLTERKHYAPPYVLKIDVDGRDLDVARGATRILADTECVVMESTVPEMLPRIQFMKEQGLQLWDIVDLCYASEPMAQADLVFVAGPLFDILPRDPARFWQL